MAARVTELRIPDWTYAESHSRKLVPVDVVVRCQGPPKPMFVLPYEVLPFGFLASVELVAVNDDTPIPRHRIQLMKSTGMRASAPHEYGRCINVTYRDMCNNEDAADPDFKLVTEETGHHLQHRTVPGTSIVGLAVEFYGPPPTTFDVVYHTANILQESGANVYKARRKLAAHQAVPLLFPPLTRERRMARLMPRIQKTLESAP
jgi:hypothetical protein